MKRNRDLMCCVLALAVAAFALPAFGANSQNKTYNLSMSVLAPGLGVGPSDVQAIIRNTSPRQSNGSINSVDLFVDLNWTPVADSFTIFESTRPSQLYTPDLSQKGHIRISKLNPLKPGDTLTIRFKVMSSSCGDASWDAVAWSGSQFNGNFFTRDADSALLTEVPCADVACLESFPQLPSVPGPAGSVFTTRGLNKDGSGLTSDGATGPACAALDYFASDTAGNNTGLSEDLVHFRWDQSGAFASASFLYTIFYAAVPPNPIRVGWLDQNGHLAVGPGVDQNSVVAIDAPTCLGGTNAALPSPLGKLTADIDDNSTTLKATFSHPPVPFPFPIVVGSERMNVTGPGQNVFTWKVQRGALLTTPAAHASDAVIMSTPLPAIPEGAPAPYVAGGQAQMCVVDGTVEYHQGENGPVFRYSKQIIDIGDGWVLGR